MSLHPRSPQQRYLLTSKDLYYGLSVGFQLMWYRNLFLPKLTDRHNWHASPIFAPEENFPKLPPTLVTVAELGTRVPSLFFSPCVA
jgi:acetyl esterase/lipase